MLENLVCQGLGPGPDGYSDNFNEDACRAIANANVYAAWFGMQRGSRHEDR